MRRTPLLIAALLVVAGLAPLPALISPVAADESAPVAGSPDRLTAPAAAQQAHVRIVRDGGEEDTIEIDLSGIGEAIDEAMREVGRELEGLDGKVARSHADGHRIIILKDGERSEVDLDAILEDVRETLGGALVCAHDGAATAHRTLRAHGRQARSGPAATGDCTAGAKSGKCVVKVLRGDAAAEAGDDEPEGIDDGQLRAQLKELRAELRSLRAELRSLRAESRR